MLIESYLDDLQLARQAIAEGQVLAYPTEAVYGLGCDPFQTEAVARVLALKHRQPAQGLIVLISDWAQLFPLIAPIADEVLDRVRQTWPGPVTWLFPKSQQVPQDVCGKHPSIAIRMSAHPIARALCQDSPIISTSANIHGLPPARSLAELSAQFPQGLDGVVAGELGQASKPSAIYDVLTGNQLR